MLYIVGPLPPPFIKEGVELSKFLQKNGGGLDFSHKKRRVGKIGGIFWPDDIDRYIGEQNVCSVTSEPSQSSSRRVSSVSL